MVESSYRVLCVCFLNLVFPSVTMDNDTPISKAFLRPAIWCKRLRVYTIPSIVDNCCLEISGIMEVPGK